MKLFGSAVILAAALFSSVCAFDLILDDPYTFGEYVIDFHKAYSADEYDMRREIFEERLQDIKSHNTHGRSTYRKGVNHLTDHTDTELKGMLGWKSSPKARLAKLKEPNLAAPMRKLTELPEELSWVEKGATTPPKNQGQCGSEAIESALYISTGKVYKLSEQLYVSCTPNDDHCGGQGGCFGATQDILFQYAMEHGFVLEGDYPYVSGNGTEPACRNRQLKQPAGYITGYVDVAVNDLDAHLIAVNSQPLAVSVDASNWHLYHSGVLEYDDCGTDINHAVVMEGYGTDKTTGQEYFLIRNSWGPAWGEQGYIRLARSAKCDMDTTPLDGSGCEGDTDPVEVCGTCGVLSSTSYPIGAYLL